MNNGERKPEENASEVLKGLQSYWTDRSPSYSTYNIEEMNNWKRKAWTDLILQYAPEGRRLRVLDVGTGPGFFAMALALAGHDVTAVDVTEQMLAHARENAAAYGAEVKFVLHRGEALPFADDSFDLIVSRNVTWNLEFPEEALREWKRVLRPGGRMVYFDANWYLYLYDEDLRERYTAYRKEFEKQYPDYTGDGKISAARLRDLELLAYDLPLSRENRPTWDRNTLAALGLRIVQIIEDVGPLVQDEAERARGKLTPLFMVCAEKLEDCEERSLMTRDQASINAHWTKGSDNYDRIIHDELASFRVAGWQELIAAQTGNRKELDVLDCGCGPAFFTIILSKAGYRVTGIDAAAGMLVKARKNIAEYHTEATILEMDCHALSFPENTFDLVVSRNVTHTLRDHVQVYSEWLRVLKPGGTLLIFDANWHLPQASDAMFRDSAERERKCIELYGSDFSGNTVFDDNAEFSEKNRHPHPLGDLMRPDWDCGILRAVGFSDISYVRDITGLLWDDKEKLVYGNTPMFMLRANKPINA